MCFKVPLTFIEELFYLSFLITPEFCSQESFFSTRKLRIVKQTISFRFWVTQPVNLSRKIKCFLICSCCLSLQLLTCPLFSISNEQWCADRIQVFPRDEYLNKGWDVKVKWCVDKTLRNSIRMERLL